MTEKCKCPLCKTQIVQHQQVQGNSAYFMCDNCGNYTVVGWMGLRSILEDPKYGKSYLLRAYVYRQNKSKVNPNITIELLDNIEDYIHDLGSPLNKLIELISHIADSSSYFKCPVKITTKMETILVLKNTTELKGLLHYAVDNKLLIETPEGFILTFEGWQWHEQYKHRRINSRQVFVAMSFGDALKPVYDEAIVPALTEIGYKPIRIDCVEHDDDICDMIISEIRKSCLVVADFTEQKKGVYFEAGFAQGLGIPVIRTCQKAELDDLHLDTRNYRHLGWSSTDELRNLLSNHIQALYPLPQTEA